MFRSSCAAALGVLVVSCASTQPPRREPASAEKTGELAKPGTDCFRPPEPGTSWDVLNGMLRPGEHV
jgi:hypothetical protein